MVAPEVQIRCLGEPFPGFDVVAEVSGRGARLVELGSPTGIPCSPAIVCPIGDLAPGASRVFTLSETVRSGFTGGSVIDIAAVSGATDDPFGGNNSAISLVLVAPSVGLSRWQSRKSPGPRRC